VPAVLGGLKWHMKVHPANGSGPRSARTGRKRMVTEHGWNRTVWVRSSSAEATSPGVSAFEGAPFIPGESSPDPGLLSGLDGPSQADVNDLTATADNFGFLYLAQRGAGVSESEEQFWVLVQAGTVVAPRHQIGPFEYAVVGVQHHASRSAYRLVSPWPTGVKGRQMKPYSVAAERALRITQASVKNPPTQTGTDLVRPVRLTIGRRDDQNGQGVAVRCSADRSRNRDAHQPRRPTGPADEPTGRRHATRT